MRKISMMLLILLAAAIGAAYAQECCTKESKTESKVSAAVKGETVVKKADAACECATAGSGPAQEAKTGCSHAKKVDSEVKGQAHISKTIETSVKKAHEQGEGREQNGSCCGHAEKHETGEKAHGECNCKSHEAEKQKEKK